ncbi:aldehyde dehydrogenase family protein, partial [Nonomuraea guangzhouensis]
MDAIYQAGCLVAGTWLTDGPATERTGPYLRRTVSRARTATPDDITRALDHAGRAAGAVARLAPATRAAILERGAAEVTARGEELARLLAVELGKPLKDGRGEVLRVADTLSVSTAEARALAAELVADPGVRVVSS